MPLTDRQKAHALKGLEKRDRSLKELTDWLMDKGESPEVARECVRWLAELRLIDDERYAAQIVRHYAGKGYGAARVKNELYRRGIPRELWDGALEHMPEPDDTIDRLLRAKLKSEVPDRAELKRATDALLRRGYRWEEISSAVERLKNDDY